MYVDFKFHSPTQLRYIKWRWTVTNWYTLYEKFHVTGWLPSLGTFTSYVRDTSDMDTCLHVNKVSSLDSPCQNIYIRFLKNPTLAGDHHYGRRNNNSTWHLQEFHHYDTTRDSITSITRTPHMIKLLQLLRRDTWFNYFIHYDTTHDSLTSITPTPHMIQLLQSLRHHT